MGNWEAETAMDVEWAHAVAPGANILLVEANSNDQGDLLKAVNFAAYQPGVSAVSMSFGSPETADDPSHDGTFTAAPGHIGVTFVASSGDHGAEVNYPAASPNVLAVGGTFLSADKSGNYEGETAWSMSGGGVSQYELTPTYQLGLFSGRSVPDVAYNMSNPIAVCDSFNSPGAPWVTGGGTSEGAPQWAGLIAIANQARVLANNPTLGDPTKAMQDGPYETMFDLYAMPPSAFHDVATGSSVFTSVVNGSRVVTGTAFPATPGYDLVTGLGSPVANRIVANLTGPFYIDQGGTPGVLTVVGSQLGTQAETITVDATPAGGVTVTLNGEVAQYAPGEVNAINVLDGDGTVAVNVEHTLAGVPVTITAGKGLNFVNISPAAQNLNNLQGGVKVIGNGALTFLRVYDQAAAAGTTYDLESTTVGRPGSANITYSGVGGGLTLNASSGGHNQISVSATGHNLYNFPTTLTLNGGGGDTLTVNDQASFGSITYNIDPTVISDSYFGGGGSIWYAGVTNLKLNASAGYSTINVSPKAHNLDGFPSLTIDGGASGYLYVNDQANSAGSSFLFDTSYTVTNQSLTRTITNLYSHSGSTTSINYSHLAGLTLNASNSANGVDVESTPAPTNVIEGLAASTVSVSQTAENLDRLGSLTIDGGKGGATLTVCDQNDLNTLYTLYTVTGTGLSRLGYTLPPGGYQTVIPASISYAHLTGLELDAGNISPIISVESTPALSMRPQGQGRPVVAHRLPRLPLQQHSAQVEVEPEVLRVAPLRRRQERQRISSLLPQGSPQPCQQLRGQRLEPHLPDQTFQFGGLLPQGGLAEAVGRGVRVGLPGHGQARRPWSAVIHAQLSRAATICSRTAELRIRAATAATSSPGCPNFLSQKAAAQAFSAPATSKWFSTRVDALRRAASSRSTRRRSARACSTRRRRSVGPVSPSRLWACSRTASAAPQRARCCRSAALSRAASTPWRSVASRRSSSTCRATACRSSHSPPAPPSSRTSTPPAHKAATAGRRRAHLSACSSRPTGRARIGSPARKRPRSLASSSALA
jgi:hypothetical protein